MSRLRATAIAAFVALLALLIVATVVLGTEPTAVPALLDGGDLRSDGAGPGLVGNPLLILLAVLGLGLATAAVTVLVVRLTQRD